MDFKKIKPITERYRVLTGLCSLPFIVDISGSTTICWFNYFLEQSVNSLTITINDVFTLAEDEEVSTHKMSCAIQVELGEYDEPQMQDSVYYANLEKIYAAFSREQMDLLLRASEMSPLLPAYEKVVQLLNEREE